MNNKKAWIEQYPWLGRLLVIRDREDKISKTCLNLQEWLALKAEIETQIIESFKDEILLAVREIYKNK